MASRLQRAEALVTPGGKGHDFRHSTPCGPPHAGGPACWAPEPPSSQGRCPRPGHPREGRSTHAPGVPPADRTLSASQERTAQGGQGRVWTDPTRCPGQRPRPSASRKWGSCRLHRPGRDVEPHHQPTRDSRAPGGQRQSRPHALGTEVTPAACGGQKRSWPRAGDRGGAGRAVAQRTPLRDGPWTSEVGPPGGWDTGQGLAKDAHSGHALSGTVGGIRMWHVGTLSFQRGPARPRPQGSSTGTHEPSRFHKAQERGAAGRAGAGRGPGKAGGPLRRPVSGARGCPLRGAAPWESAQAPPHLPAPLSSGERPESVYSWPCPLLGADRGQQDRDVSAHQAGCANVRAVGASGDLRPAGHRGGDGMSATRAGAPR